MLGAVINPLQRGPGFRNLKHVKSLDGCLVPTATPECRLVLFAVLIIATRGGTVLYLHFTEAETEA